MCVSVCLSVCGSLCVCVSVCEHMEVRVNLQESILFFHPVDPRMDQAIRPDRKCLLMQQAIWPARRIVVHRADFTTQ